MGIILYNTYKPYSKTAYEAGKKEARKEYAGIKTLELEGKEPLNRSEEFDFQVGFIEQKAELAKEEYELKRLSIRRQKLSRIEELTKK